MSGSMIPPVSDSGDFSDENVCQSRETAMTSSYFVTTQKPRSLPSVSVGGWNHTGASRRKNVNHSCGNAAWKRSMSVRSMSLSCTAGLLRAAFPSLEENETCSNPGARERETLRTVCR